MKRRLKRRYVNSYQTLFCIIIKLKLCIRFNKLASKYFWKLTLISFLMFFSYFRLIFSLTNTLHTNASGWCLMNCTNFHRLAKCIFHLPDFLISILVGILLKKFTRFFEGSKTFRDFIKKLLNFYAAPVCFIRLPPLVILLPFRFVIQNCACSFVSNCCPIVEKEKNLFLLIRFVTEQQRMEEDVKYEKLPTLSLLIEVILKRRKRLESVWIENMSTN